MIEFDCCECEGKGSYKINDDIPEEECYLCKGTGKLDWIDTIFPYEHLSNSALGKVDVRRLVKYVNKTIEKLIEDSYLDTCDSKTLNQISNNISEGVLKPIKFNRGIYDYKVDSSIVNNSLNVDVMIIPKATVSQIHMNFKVI